MASPHQIEELLVKKVRRVPELLAIAEITHKYHFVEIGPWCTNILKEVFILTTVTPMHLERMLRVAILSNDRSLFTVMVSSISTHLLKGTLAPTDILIIADRHNIHELQGVAYYAQLMALQKRDSDELTFPTGVSLSREQRIRLLAGHWSLVRKWERLRASPFQDSSCTAHGPTCAIALTTWRVFTHRQALAQYPLADVVGKVEQVWSWVQEWVQNETRVRQGGPLVAFFPSVCHVAVLYAAENLPKTIQASLRDYFSDRLLGPDSEESR